MNSNTIFSSIRRGYSELNDSEPSDIINYFQNLDDRSLTGHISNIKGILFENVVTEQLNQQGIETAIFESPNHPLTDIAIFDNGEVINEFQLKATDSVEYIRNTLEAHPDIPIITTSEVAGYFDNEFLVIDSGISNSYLTDSVSSILKEDSKTEISAEVTEETISDSLGETVTDCLGETLLPIPIPISPLGLIIKGLFLIF